VIATDFHDGMATADQERLKSMAMSPADVVTASLAALAAGEVVCAPSLEDATAIDRLGEAQRVLMGAAGKMGLASRYGPEARLDRDSR